MNNIFLVGTQFNTLANFEDSLHKLESSERQKFRITNSRLLDKKEGNKLRFAYATFSCERTGEYKPTGSGVRQASSKKCKCPAFIKIRANSTKSYLEVKDVVLQHNHNPLEVEDEGTADSDDPDTKKLSRRIRKRVYRMGVEDIRKTALKPIIDNLMDILIDSSTNEVVFNEGLEAVTKVLHQLQKHQEDNQLAQRAPPIDRTHGGTHRTDQSTKLDGNDSCVSATFGKEIVGCNGMNNSDVMVAADPIEKKTAESVQTSNAVVIAKYSPTGSASINAEFLENDEISDSALTAAADAAVEQAVQCTEQASDIGVDSNEVETGRGQKKSPNKGLVSSIYDDSDGDDDFNAPAAPTTVDHPLKKHSHDGTARKTTIEELQYLVTQPGPSTSEVDSETDLASIVMPSKVKGKGGVNGLALTAIGLPRKLRNLKSSKKVPAGRSTKYVNKDIVSPIHDEMTESATSTNSLPKRPNKDDNAQKIVPEKFRCVRAPSGSSTVEAHSETDLASVVMPLKVSGRGRPKGRVLSAVGLPLKAKHPVAFVDDCAQLQIRHMLSWLIDNSTIDSVISGEHLICKIDLQLEDLKDSIVDKSVNLNLLVPYCEAGVFALLKKAVNKKKKKDELKCGRCEQRIVDNSVICDRCLLWHHFKCVMLKNAPKTDTWFCPHCAKKK